MDRIVPWWSGALAPVRVVLSRSIVAYSAPSALLADTMQFPGTAGYSRRLHHAGAPWQPASGSVLSPFTLSQHAVLCAPGVLVGCMFPVVLFTDDNGLCPSTGGSAHSIAPPSASGGSRRFGVPWFARGL